MTPPSPSSLSAPNPAIEGAMNLALVAEHGIARIVAAVRAHLRMDVSFVAEFTDRSRIFHHVDFKNGRRPLQEGQVAPIEDGYCLGVIEGRIPELIPDTAKVPAVQGIPETAAIPVGAHLSVPIRLRDGRLYGTFCCFSFNPDPSLNERDIAMMRAFADVIAHALDCEATNVREYGEKLRRIQDAIAAGEPHIVYQPVYRLKDRKVVGIECLSRFRTAPFRTPDRWFAHAAEVGLGPELEMRAVRNALEELENVKGDFQIMLNVSSSTIMCADLAHALESVDITRIVLELTEHEYLERYGPLLNALDPLRAKGLKIAIDDTGAGYASMRHLLYMRADMIKLDMSLTREIDSDPMRRALATALVSFANATGSQIIAEGIENQQELLTLTSLGVSHAQGFHLAKPMPLEEILPILG